MKKYWLLVVFVFVLQSCGFQLRQSVSLPDNLQPIHVKASGATQTSALLQRHLSEQGIAMTDDPNKAKLWLELSEEVSGERTISVSTATTATLKEVELTHQLYIQLSKPNGTVLVKKKPLRLVREFIYDEQAVLAKASEEQVLRDDMQQEILAHIIRRLSHVQDTSKSSE